MPRTGSLCGRTHASPRSKRLYVKFGEANPEPISSTLKLRPCQTQNGFGNVVTMHLYPHSHRQRLGRPRNYLELERRLQKANGVNASALDDPVEPSRK